MKRLGLLSLTVLTVLGWSVGVTAQTTPNCRPPKAGEFIVLVRSPTPALQAKVRSALPANTDSIICKYLNETVTRTGSFTQQENANAQAQYLKNTLGVSAFVVRAEPQPANTAYNPKPLGTGYAVLVDYFNRPEVAKQVQQVLGSNVGLITYGEKPYLLAIHTQEQTQANAALKKLSDRGFFAMLVDSRKVMLLRAKIAG